MTNHPNRRRLPYRVRYERDGHGQLEAAFTVEAEARLFSQWVCARTGRGAEISQTHGETRGIIGRYDHYGNRVPDPINGWSAP